MMKMPFAVAACLAAMVMTCEVGARTWTSTDGKTIEAQFIRASGNSVLVNLGGKTVTIPLDRLSQTDRDWVAAQSSTSAPAASGADFPKRIGEILERALKAEPSEDERKEVVAFLTATLPDKGADGEEMEWKVEFLPYGSPYPRESALISAVMLPKGGVYKDRLINLQFHFYGKPRPVLFGEEKFGRYRAARIENVSLYVTAGRTDVRTSGQAPAYKNNKHLEAIMEKVDLEAISKI